MLAGCSDADRRMWKPQSPTQCYHNALEAKLGDDRRDAVARIAESGYVASEDSFQVLDAVARTDPVAQVRCVAIRGFTRYYDYRPVRTLLSILQATPESKEALPGSDDVRWEAAGTLLALERRGVLAGPGRDAACTTYIKLLEADSSRQVRVVAAEALGRFQDRRVLTPLVAAVRNEDFAIADQAERSLIALTGTTHDYDAEAWERWLAATENPFERAGQKPPTTRPTGPTWFDKQIRAWRRGLKLGNVD